MVQVKQMLVPSSRASRARYSGTNPKKYIVVHQTGNTSRGANANMHARLQYNGNSRSASWHEQIDGDGVIQSFSHNDMLWHAGDGRNGKGNGQGIALELCVHSDGNYNKTIENGVARVKQLMDMYNIPIGNVINHRDCSGKWCPSQLLGGKNGITWKKFKDRVAGAKAPSESTSTTVKPSSGNKYNGSIVDYLTQEGIKSNIENRKNLAVEYGIVSKESDYTGTAKQNTDLLNAMLKGEPKQEGTRKEPIQSGYTGNSIVDYLASIKVDNSFENRKALAKKHLGINNYTGTAKQNKDLLNKMRGGKSSGSTKSSTKNVTNYKGDSIVNYLNLDGNSHLGGSSFKKRKRLAEVNGINNYTGTASQNRQLLNKLQSGGSSSNRKTTKQLADEVEKGLHGDWEARKKSLGNRYAEVQREINRRYS